MKNKIFTIFTGIILLIAFFGIPAGDDEYIVPGLLSPGGGGGVLSPVGPDFTQMTYDFGVVDIPTERPGAASSSTGFEFGRMLVTGTTAFTVASTSTGFAFTVQESGDIKGCSFSLQTLPNTGTVSIMIQKNGTLQTGTFCKLPTSGTFATNGGIEDMSSNEVITNITFVAGDRLGLIASSSDLNAATFDGNAKLIIEIRN